jgi:probable F420-dependent oxidoreductase
MARSFRVGVQLPEVERVVHWPEYVAMAEAAEAAGFDSVWVGDHLLYPAGRSRPERGPWEAWTLLAALAAVTERVTLGPLVACLGFHPPGLVAKMAATIDDISGSRFVLGVGAGWNEVEFTAFGIPFDHRAARFAESFDVVRRLLAGERVSVNGRYTTVDGAVLVPPPSRHIPLMVGSTGERVLALTLPHVHWWNVWYDWFGNTPDGFAAANAQISAAAERVERDPSTLRRSACVQVVLDRAAADRPIDPAVPPVEGSPSRIAAILTAMAEAGADEVICIVSPITVASIDRLGETLALL